MIIIHSSHFGMVKMKAMARNQFWWPSIDKAIELFCKQCPECSTLKTIQKTEANADTSWPQNDQPFERLHMDFAGSVENHYFLVVVDDYSKYPFVAKTLGTTSCATIAALKSIFAMFGIPKAIVADNGPAFRAEEFLRYMTTRGIEVWHTPVGHPQSNRQAERFIGNLKLHLKATTGQGDLDSRLQSCLLLLSEVAVLLK